MSVDRTDIAFTVALALVVAGVALLTVPGAFMVAGVLLGAFTALYERGADPRPGAE